MGNGDRRDDISKAGAEKPVIDFNLPGFLSVVKKKGAERATLEVIEDLLVLTYKALRGHHE